MMRWPCLTKFASTIRVNELLLLVNLWVEDWRDWLAQCLRRPTSSVRIRCGTELLAIIQLYNQRYAEQLSN